MKRLFSCLLLASVFSISSNALAYDAEMAESYAKLFEPAVEAKVGKQLGFIKPEKLAERVNKGVQFTVIDVRTEAESSLFGFKAGAQLAMPISELFKKENLDKIPTDQEVIVVCKSGARAAAAGTALRHLGFDNVKILKGGFKALSAYFGAKEAYPEK